MTNNPSMDQGEFASQLAALQKGDEATWEHVFRNLAGPVLGYLRMRNATNPEDLCSEVFLRVARGVAKFEGDESAFRSWVFTITHRQLLDERRRSGRTPTLVSSHDRLDEPVDNGWAVDEQAGAVAAWRDALAVVERLTVDQREVLLLRVVGGLSIAEVAEIVGKKPNAVKQLQHRAVARLRQIVGPSHAPSTANWVPNGGFEESSAEP